MSVLIKGMKMPVSCEECSIKSWDEEGYVCPFSGIPTLNIGIQNDCPLIEVPTPHGRLIDGSELVVKYDLYAPIAPVVEGDSEYWTNIIYTKYILNAPTVIEAEDE